MALKPQPLQPLAIALGSNLGDSKATLTQALEGLDQIEGVTVLCRSGWYVSSPVGPIQPNYLNGCALLNVGLAPEILLDHLLEMENRFGRVRAERWGPRTLDLDLILYGQMQLDTPRLQVPHPRFRERAFVLLPLAEIAPEWIDPVTGNTVQQLVNLLGQCGDIERLENNA